MVLMTASGPVRGSRRSRYLAWLRGRIDSGAWTGAHTIRVAWSHVAELVRATRNLRDCAAIGRAQGIGEQQVNKD